MTKELGSALDKEGGSSKSTIQSWKKSERHARFALVLLDVGYVRIQRGSKLRRREECSHVAVQGGRKDRNHF